MNPSGNLLRVRSDAPSTYSWQHKLTRAVWGAVWLVLFRPTPRNFHGWRNFLLRLFGARLARTAQVANSVVVWAPWNLTMEDHATIGPHVDCYCVAAIHVGAHATVSQYSYLCAAGHDPFDPGFRPTMAPISVKDQAWVGADVFIGAGVTVGQGAVVGARSSVFADVPPWTISAGNPAQVLQARELTEVRPHE